MTHTLSLQTLSVLRAMLDDAAGEHYGLQLGRTAGLCNGTVYPMLERMQRDGWLTSR